MPSTIVTSRAYSPILVADDPNEVYDEDRDNDEACPTRMGKKLVLKGQPSVLNMLLKTFHQFVVFEVDTVPLSS